MAGARGVCMMRGGFWLSEMFVIGKINIGKVIGKYKNYLLTIDAWCDIL
jgi:hypothetical protein